MITVFEMASGQLEMTATQRIEEKQIPYLVNAAIVGMRLLSIDEAVAADQCRVDPKFLAIPPLEL